MQMIFCVLLTFETTAWKSDSFPWFHVCRYVHPDRIQKAKDSFSLGEMILSSSDKLSFLPDLKWQFQCIAFFYGFKPK